MSTMRYFLFLTKFVLLGSHFPSLLLLLLMILGRLPSHCSHLWLYLLSMSPYATFLVLTSMLNTNLCSQQMQSGIVFFPSNKSVSSFVLIMSTFFWDTQSVILNRPLSPPKTNWLTRLLLCLPNVLWICPVLPIPRASTLIWNLTIHDLRCQAF